MVGPRLAVIYCGGTIAMMPTADSSLGFAGGKAAEQSSLRGALMQAGLPASSDWLPVQSVAIDGLKTELPAIDSSAIDASYWQCLVTTVLELPSSYDGVIVLHGTDTMAYTAAALSIALAAAGFTRPVVITGSQRPIRTAGGEFDASSDGVANIRDAVATCQQAISANAEGASFTGPLVQLVFAGARLHGARCSKVHSYDDSGFAQRLVPSGERRESRVNKAWSGDVGDMAAFCDGVADIVVTPGLEAEQLGHMLRAPGLKAAVIRFYGSGTINPAHFSALQVAIPVVAVSACFEGGVQVASYDASVITDNSTNHSDRSLALINGGAMSPEAAVAKLMWILADTHRANNAESWIAFNVAGELGWQ